MPVSLTTEGELEHHERWHYTPETLDKFESFRDDPRHPRICIWRDDEDGWLCEHERLDALALRVLLLKTPEEAKAWAEKQGT